MSPRAASGGASGGLASRWPYYLAFGALFALVYGGLALAGRFPRWLLFGVLVVSFAKDVYDEYRLRRGLPPLIYAGVEHAPSNAVLLVLLLSGLLEPPGALVGVPAWSWAVLLAVVDLVFDVSQDLRAHFR